MLRARLTFGLLPLLLLLLGVCFYAYRTSQSMGATVDAILDRNYRTIRAVADLRDTARRMDAAVSFPLPEDRTIPRRAFAEQVAVFRRQLTAEMLRQPDPVRADLLNEVERSYERFAAAGEELLVFSSLSAVTDAGSGFVAVNETLNDLRDHDQEAILAAGIEVSAQMQESLGLLLGAMVVAAMLFFVLAWRLAGSLLRPIQALTQSAAALGEGNLDAKVPVSSRDEIGQLAMAFNTMAGRLRIYRDATQEKVVRTQRTMEAALTSTPDPVIVIARDGQETVRNPAAVELARTTSFGEGLPPAVTERLQEVMRTGEHYLPTDYGCVVSWRRAGEERHFLPRILSIGDELTGFSGAAVILQDVTKLRLLDDMKTNLVGTVSHELKTPLTSLRLAVYLLLEPGLGTLGERQRELLESAREDVDRLLHMLDNLLDLARLEAGVASLDFSALTVQSLVEEMAAESGQVIAAAGTSLKVEVDPGVGQRQIRVDLDRIRHVFGNLLGNAAKYGGSGGPVTLRVTGAPEEFARFIVIDRGPGIPDESLSRVFDRFYRVPGQEKKGTGLGLAIAREIVVAHGGSIHAQAGEPTGVEFHVLLPLDPESTGTPAADGSN